MLLELAMIESIIFTLQIFGQEWAHHSPLFCCHHLLVSTSPQGLCIVQGVAYIGRMWHNRNGVSSFHTPISSFLSCIIPPLNSSLRDFHVKKSSHFAPAFQENNNNNHLNLVNLLCYYNHRD